MLCPVKRPIWLLNAMSCKTSYVAAKYVVDKWIILFWSCCKKNDVPTIVNWSTLSMSPGHWPKTQHRWGQERMERNWYRDGWVWITKCTGMSGDGCKGCGNGRRWGWNPVPVQTSSPYPKWHLNWFSCLWPTDRDTDHGTSVTTGHILCFA